jgi:hypothetical protein
MYSDEGGKSQEEEEIEGVRVPCRDAKRRVWQAIDLLKQERTTYDRSRRTASVRRRSSPSSEKKNAHRVGGGI